MLPKEPWHLTGFTSTNVVGICWDEANKFVLMAEVCDHGAIEQCITKFATKGFVSSCFFLYLYLVLFDVNAVGLSHSVTLVWLLVQMCIISLTIGCWQISRSACPLFQRKLVSAHGISQWSNSHSDHTLAHGFDWKSDIAQKSVKISKWRVIFWVIWTMGKNMRSADRHQI